MKGGENVKIAHDNALQLESIVRKVYHCDRGGMGGFIDADHFESSPFDAALIALATLWEKLDFHSIEDFLHKWEDIFRNPDSDEPAINDYINELKGLVKTALN